MGSVLLVGGVIGSVIGVHRSCEILRQAGQFDLFVALSYVTFLGVIGTLMLIESVNTIRTVRSGRRSRLGARSGQHSWIARPAVQDALPPLEALHQRHPAVR